MLTSLLSLPVTSEIIISYQLVRMIKTEVLNFLLLNFDFHFDF
jgi:hypothetical protein